MTKNLDIDGLKSIVDSYDIFYIDLWGVVHNGLKLHQGAILALKELSNLKKDFVLLTNAPRPNKVVRVILEKLGMEDLFLKHVYTSGQAALNFLSKEYKDKNFYHIGPTRDFDLFLKLKHNKTEDLNKSEYLLCTGLFEKEDKDLNYYKKLFDKHLNKLMICTNPDLIVDRGVKRELCAGSVAMVFEKMGGKVTYFGKPYPQVYKQSIDTTHKKVLCIGDNLNTDIKGANLLNYDSLIIANGIHKSEIKKNGILETSKAYEVICNYIQSELKW